MWQHEGKTYRDYLARSFVAVEDTPENRQFFVQFKAQLKIRFQQLDIGMAPYPIEIV